MSPDAPDGPRWLVPGAFILLGLLWGSSFLWIKIAVDGGLGPANLVAYRMSIGALGMLVFLPFIRQSLPRDLESLGHLAVLGLINAALPIFLISWGEQLIDSGTAAVLNSLTPIFSLIIAGLWLRTEPVTALRVMGVLLGFGGAAVLASRELGLHGDSTVLFGVAAVTIAAFSYAGGASYATYRVKGTHRYVVAGGTLLFAAIYGWIAAFALEGPQIPPSGTIIAVAWLGVLGSFVAYLCFFLLIERLGATMATMVTYIFPVVGVALGVIVLLEPLDARLLIGTALVVVGIIVVSLRYHAAVTRAPGEARP